MRRVTVSMPDELLKRLRFIAAERRTSTSALIREAVEEKVTRHHPKPKSLGVGQLGHRDTSARTALSARSRAVGVSRRHRPVARFAQSQ